MELFEKDFYEIAKNIVFREKIKLSEIQKEMKKDLNSMKQLNDVIIAADKSDNYYTCDVPTFRILRQNNVQKEYRKSSNDKVEKANEESNKYAKDLKLDGRIQKHTTTECFLTIKDHKGNFLTRPEFRLINTAKNGTKEGIVSGA